MTKSRTHTLIKAVLVIIVIGGVIAFVAKILHDRALAPKESRMSNESSEVRSLEVELSKDIDQELSPETFGY